MKTACRTRHHNILYFSQRLFSVELQRRLQIDPVENERWLKNVEMARKNRWAREEAVLAAMREVATYFPKNNMSEEVVEKNRMENKNR